MEYQQTQPCEKIIPIKFLHKPWEVVGADVFTITYNILLCIIGYYSKFPVKKNCLLADNVIRAVTVVLAEFDSVSFRHKFHII